MTEFIEQDLSGARFERVLLSGAEFSEVRLNDARLRQVDLSGVEMRATYFGNVRLRGVEMANVQISGELHNVVVNGVDIAPLVEAELNRRMPERAKMRPDDVAGFREAWAILGRLWEGTIDRARGLPPEALHLSVDDEWSFIETLRHLGFASAAWVGGLIQREPRPWHPLDLPWDEAPGWEEVPWDREVRPSLNEVLRVRKERRAMVDGVLDSLTDERLADELTSTEPGWPSVESATVGEALRVVLNEEWEHRLYAERDLALIERDG